MGSQNLIPGHKSYILRVRRIYDLCSGVTPILSFTDHLHSCYRLHISVSLFKYFKRVLVDVSTSLPDPKGPLSDYVPTASIAEANKEVLKAVAVAIARVAIPRIFNKVT